MGSIRSASSSRVRFGVVESHRDHEVVAHPAGQGMRGAEALDQVDLELSFGFFEFGGLHLLGDFYLSLHLVTSLLR